MEKVAVLASHEAPSPDRAGTEAGPDSKRRRIRKGTRSCWECKRRKIRCNFGAETDTVCVGCQRRGATCIGQEYPEEVSLPADKGRQMGDRIVRVEALIEQLVKKVGADGTISVAPTDASHDPNPGVLTPGSSDSEPPTRPLAILESSQDALDLENEDLDAPRPHVGQCAAKAFMFQQCLSNGLKNERLTEVLQTAFPACRDLKIIYSCGGDKAAIISLMMTVPIYPGSTQDDSHLNPLNLFKLPAPNLHPVLMARHMLLLATALQYVHPSAIQLMQGLSEPFRDIMRKLADAAIRLVTTNDELLGSIESLHCILMEGLFQANCGNLRRSWLALRRAITVAQLMGVHRSHHRQPVKVLDPRKPPCPQYMWYRLVAGDRMLSLMLGLPQSTLDTSMASGAAMASDTPMGRLERTQVALSGRILERNESDIATQDYASTKEIDLELQKAAQQLPAKWWLPPDVAGAGENLNELFVRIWQLLRQVYHYNLLNQLHLPYMLRANSRTLERGRFEYSRNTCVTSSRELLSRYALFRTQKIVSFCCRSVDFYALMAGMTLLLAHIDGHRQRPGDNMLAHQRLSDRAMVEGLLETLETAHDVNVDALAEKSAGLLRRLLAIEADAAEGRHSSGTSGVQSAAEQHNSSNGENVLRVCIPYFGVVRIAAEGIISKETSTPQAATATPTTANAQLEREVSYHTLNEMRTLGSSILPPLSACPAQTTAQPVFYASTPTAASSSNAYSSLQPEQQAAMMMIQESNQFASPSFSAAVSDAIEQQYLYPGLTAGSDDWALQGVDLAFFDSLMRGATSAGTGSSSDETGLGPGYPGDSADGFCDWSVE